MDFNKKSCTALS